MKSGFRFTISTRIIAGFAAISFISLLSFGFILYYLNKGKQITEHNLDVLGPSVQKIEALSDLISNSRMLIKNWVYIDRQADTPDKLKLKKLHAEDFPALRDELNKLSKNWDKDLRDKYMRLSSSVSDTLFEHHKYIMNSLVDMDSYDDPMIAFEINPMVLEDGEVELYAIQLMEQAAGIYKALSAHEDKGNQEMRDAFRALIYFITIAIVIILLSAVLTSVFTAHSIRKPVEQLKANLNNKSKGVFKLESLHDQNDEIGDMARAVRNMTSNILDSVTKIKKEAILLDNNSAQISQSAESISAGANLQATSTEELSASIEEITESIRQNAENAQHADNTTSRLNENIATINNSISATSAAMTNITKKVSVISEIAKRVDILSINASIEAARAGKAGKGFGVVAAEVRKLADNTSKAARTINEVSEDSLKVAEESRLLIENIVPEIELAIKQVREISSSSLEQTSGIKQIRKAIQELGGVTQQNAASADQLFGSSTELLRQSNDLRKSIAFFKTDEQKLKEIENRPIGKVAKEPKEGRAPVLLDKTKGLEKPATDFKGVAINLKDDDNNDFESF